MDWSLLGCGRGGHVTYAPDEPALRRRMTASTPAGEAWRCLRCGTFVTGPPGGSGPADAAPPVRRGKELRSVLILRIFSVERFLRALVFGAAAFGVWQFRDSRTSLQQDFNRDLPAVRSLYEDLGFNFSHSKLIGLVQHALKLDSRTLSYLAIGLAAYAVIEVIEGTGLWLAKRWGEYFAMVATSVFLPYEIYDLTAKVSALRVATFLVNLALVAYLVITKRLFGVRGGKKAYVERLQEGDILEQAAEAEIPTAEAEVPAAEAEVPAAEAEVPAAEAVDSSERAVSRSTTDDDPAKPEDLAKPGEPADPADPAKRQDASSAGTDEAVTADHGAHHPGV